MNTTNPTNTSTPTRNFLNEVANHIWVPDAVPIPIKTRPNLTVVPLDLNNLPSFTKKPYFNKFDNSNNRLQSLSNNLASRSQDSLSQVIEQPTINPNNTVNMKPLINKNNVFVPDFTETFSIRSIKEGMTAFSKNGQKNSALSISYNFPRFTINKSDIQSSESYFSIIYTSNSSSPNFVFTQNKSPNNYFSQNAYLFGVLHNIIGVTVEDDGSTIMNNIVGELVIDVGQSCYVCFILQNSHNKNTNDIDKFALLNIEHDSSSSCTNNGNTNVLSLDVILNNSITRQNWAVYYLDGTTKVFVFTNPIMVNETTATFVSKLNNTTTLFSTDVPSAGWNQITNVGITGEDEIYIDCQPTGESEDEINMRTVVLGNDTVSGSNDKISQLFLSNIATFTIIFILSWFFIPFIYRYLVIQYLNITGTSQSAKAKDYLMIGTLLFLSLVSIGLTFFYTGNSTYGINMFIFTGFSLIILYSNTFMNDNYLKTGEESIQKQSIIDAVKSGNYLNPFSLFGFLLLCIVNIFFKFNSNSDKQEARKLNIIIFILYLIGVFFVVPIIYRDKYVGTYALYSLIGGIGLLLILRTITTWMDIFDKLK